MFLVWLGIGLIIAALSAYLARYIRSWKDVIKGGPFVVLWLVSGVLAMTAMGMAYPMPYIHGFVWMGSQYVLMINAVVSSVTILALTVMAYLYYNRK